MIEKPMTSQILHSLHGGEGRVEITKIITKESGIESLDLFAKVRLDVGASIGYHEHLEDSEAYYIVSGEGIFIDYQEIEKKVSENDFCYIYKGQGHGMINCGQTPLEMLAIVLPK